MLKGVDSRLKNVESGAEGLLDKGIYSVTGGLFAVKGRGGGGIKIEAVRRFNKVSMSCLNSISIDRT
mgnify:CR=1 FL=1